MKHPRPFLAVVLCATLACSVDDSDDADTKSSDASENADATETETADATETETADATETETADATETETADATETETADETETGDPQDDPAVQCEDLTCADGELCVEPGPWCDYTQNPPTYVFPDAVCKPFPSECEDLQDGPLESCLWMYACDPTDLDLPNSAQFEEGVVDCPEQDLDCFGDPTS